MKVLHLEYHEYPAELLKILEERHEVEKYVCETQQQLYEKLKRDSYEAIFIRLGLMFDQRAIELQPELKYIITPTTGLNHIDTETARVRNIEVVSLKGEQAFLASVKSTAEHTWALLLTLIRRIPQARESVLNDEWKRELFLSDELDGKKIGIIGFGRLGKIVARYGQAFGMEVLVYDKDEAAYRDRESAVRQVTLHDLLTQSDYIVLLISFSKENEDFINADKFQLFKEGAYFVNTSRGEMVDEQALLSALQNGKLRGAALDVLKNDSSWSPRIMGSKDLLDYARSNPNLIITPHAGGYGKESTRKTKTFIVNKFLSLTQL